MIVQQRLLSEHMNLILVRLAIKTYVKLSLRFAPQETNPSILLAPTCCAALAGFYFLGRAGR